MEISKSNIKINLKNSRGSYVFDDNTKRYYLDFMSMYSSLPIGYQHEIFSTKEYQEEMLLTSQVKICNCEYNSQEKELFLKDFKEFVNHDNSNNYDFFHFSCTGALAVESAIKAAIDYTGKNKIVSFEKSFHGITSYGNLVTDRVGQTKARLDGFFGKDFWSRVKTIEELEVILKNGDIGGVLIEPIKCTSGDIYFDGGFFEKVFKLCKKYKALSIVDEIQTGFGATGRVWYTEGADILIFGKKSQVSGFMTTKDIGDCLDPIRYCVTWDGDIIDMVRCKYIIKTIIGEDLLSKLVVEGEFIKLELSDISDINNVRGEGGILAFDFESENQRDSFYNRAFENGLLTNSAGEKTIRLRPNLAISHEDAITAINIIKKSIWS